MGIFPGEEVHIREKTGTVFSAVIAVCKVLNFVYKIRAEKLSIELIQNKFPEAAAVIREFLLQRRV